MPSKLNTEEALIANIENEYERFLNENRQDPRGLWYYDDWDDTMEHMDEYIKDQMKQYKLDMKKGAAIKKRIANLLRTKKLNFFTQLLLQIYNQALALSNMNNDYRVLFNEKKDAFFEFLMDEKKINEAEKQIVLQKFNSILKSDSD